MGKSEFPLLISQQLSEEGGMPNLRLVCLQEQQQALAATATAEMASKMDAVMEAVAPAMERMKAFELQMHGMAGLALQMKAAMDAAANKQDTTSQAPNLSVLTCSFYEQQDCCSA